MTEIKPLFFFLVLLMVISVSSVFINLNVSAITSSVTSNLKVVTGVADTNQQNFVSVGSYDIIIVGKYLMFYDSDGILAKTYNVTYSPTSTSVFGSPRIAKYNSTFLVIGDISTSYPTNNYVESWFILLNVNTLATTFYNSPVDVITSTYSSANGVPKNMAIYVVDNSAFIIGTGYYSGTYGMGVWQLFPNATVKTIASIQNSISSSIPLGGCWIVVPSTDSNRFYLIAETAVSSREFLIDEICYTAGAGSITLIGVSGVSGDYSGGYIYLLNSKFITNIYGNFYNEVLIYYPDTTNQQMCLNVIRFNNTFIDVHHNVTIGGFTGTFQSPYIRLLGYDIINNGTGLDGIYNLYYVGLDYKFMQFPITLSGTNTNIIVWSSISNTKAFMFPQWQTEIYNFQTGNIGGFWNINTGIMVELDYSSVTNSLCVATKFLSASQGGSTGVGSGNGGTDGSGQGGNWYDDTTTPTPTPSPTPFNDGGGVGAIIPILTSIFGNIRTDIIFVIFGVICALLTLKFALTGLIAGIGISTFLCVMAGLLDIWAVGLCIVLDITLIVLGSGLLNKNGNNNKS